MSTDFDMSDFSKLAADLGEVSKNVGPNLRKAVEVGANNVKKDWANRAKGMPHAPAFPYSITYDIETSSGVESSSISAEIGPDKDRAQGALGNLIEFGSVNNPPQGLGTGALEAEQEDFQRGIELAETQARAAADL